MVLIVTEPTVAGRHDLGRIVGLVQHFHLPFVVCVNKHDLSPAMTAEIEEGAAEAGGRFVARVCYDRAVTEAMVAGESVVDRTRRGAAGDIVDLWAQLAEELETVAGEVRGGHGTDTSTTKRGWTSNG